MSHQLCKLVSLIIYDNFGNVVQKVAEFLLINGPSTVIRISKETKISISKVKLSLCVLLKHGFAEFSDQTIFKYAMIPQKILLILRYPKYCLLLKKKFGSIAVAILDVLFANGKCAAQDIIVAVHSQSKTGDTIFALEQVREQFKVLVTAQYLFPIGLKDNQHISPDSDLNRLCDANDVVWQVNFDRFHQDMRDRLIEAAVARRFGTDAGELMRVLVQQMYVRTEPWADVSNPVPRAELIAMFRKVDTYPRLNSHLQEFLDLLTSDPTQFVSRAGDAGGGQFAINMKKIIETLTWTTVENVIVEKFDTKAARIFRLVKEKMYIDSDQIQQLAMIPSKEAKSITYQLLEENFLQMQEIKKAFSGSGPNKCFTLFHIDLDQVARMLREICYKAVYNLAMKKLSEKEVNKRIIEKKQRVDSIASGLKLQGASLDHLKDVEEMITPPEQEILVKFAETTKKIDLVELAVDETIFILELFFRYQVCY